ncbi:MAG: PadR family transcriptional regulator [Candidatus Korarchaeum sp.]
MRTRRHHYPERRWIQFLILRILYEKPMHGYQLIEEIERRSSGYHKLDPGSVYTLLRRMEAKGFVISEWEKAEAGPARRIYRLTDEGVEVLRRGLEAIVIRKELLEDLIGFYYEHFSSGVRSSGSG